MKTLVPLSLAATNGLGYGFPIGDPWITDALSPHGLSPLKARSPATAASRSPSGATCGNPEGARQCGSACCPPVTRLPDPAAAPAGRRRRMPRP
nr:unnamed protein product [Digitaria exilis]